MENPRGILSLLKRSKKEELSKPFLENGGKLLEELLASSNGRYGIPIRNFSAQDMRRATNSFHGHNCLDRSGFSELYNGSLEGRQVIVKRFSSLETAYAIRDIAIASQMSIHKNVLKLLGCCLEVNDEGAIAAVYEHVHGRVLSHCLLNQDRENDDDDGSKTSSSLSWKFRLRIANEIARVIAYLHTALERPVVHRDIKPEIVIVDESNGVVKLFDFSISISIPLGEPLVVDRIVGTYGYAAPEYVSSGLITEKCDVYSFGVLLLSLLTGNPMQTYSLRVSEVEYYVTNNRLNKIVDLRLRSEVAKGGGAPQEQQYQDFFALALRCTRENGDNRPDMIEVAKELRRIEKKIGRERGPFILK